MRKSLLRDEGRKREGGGGGGEMQNQSGREGSESCGPGAKEEAHRKGRWMKKREDRGCRQSFFHFLAYEL